MNPAPSIQLTLPLPIFIPTTPEKPTFTAGQKRAQQPLLVSLWSLPALLTQLPLLWPVDPHLPASPKPRYRSQYLYLGPQTLLDDQQRAAMSDFEMALHLIDFSPLERELAPIYYPSRQGQVPFHPVSMFLAVCLRFQEKKSWRGLASLLAGEQGQGWRRLFGFSQGHTPSASGLRRFFHLLEPDIFAQLCPQMITLLGQHRLLPTSSTFPGDPPNQGVSVVQDGMLHQARNRHCCQLATDECYLPLPPVPVAETQPEKTASKDLATNSLPQRPCRARQKGHEGCGCDTPSCQPQCQRASRLDPEARTIHYAGHNHKHQAAGQGEEKKKTHGQGTNLFGFRSVAERLLDDRLAVAWIVCSDLYSANTDERSIFPERLQQVVQNLPGLRIGEWLADSGTGYAECLDRLYSLRILRMVDNRADKSDGDFDSCLRRGYDGRGYPLCPHGYCLYANGYDYERRRAKWVCRQRCSREPLRQGENKNPVTGCPHLETSAESGYVVNVGRTLPDGFSRLARDIPYGSEAWKARYGRRNLAESRNAQLEGMGLKRLPFYGLAHGQKVIRMADLLVNLRTLGRLVKEATNHRAKLN